MLILRRGLTLGLANGMTLSNLPDALVYPGSAKWAGVAGLHLDPAYELGASQQA